MSHTEHLPTYPIRIIIEADDPAGLAEFWMVALGYRLDDPPEGYESWEEAWSDAAAPAGGWSETAVIVPVHGHGPALMFHKSSGTPAAQNSLTLDVQVGAGHPDRASAWAAVQAHVDRLVGFGASVLGEHHDDGGSRWMVLADPNGHHFRVL